MNLLFSLRGMCKRSVGTSNFFLTDSQQYSRSASALSILFTKIILGMWYLSACCHTVDVWASTPEIERIVKMKVTCVNNRVPLVPPMITNFTQKVTYCHNLQLKWITFCVMYKCTMPYVEHTYVENPHFVERNATKFSATQRNVTYHNPP